ncbi:MAG: hypothetical protein QOE24_1239, partial [Frankiales bacterium]|nr:hypothetical protein [Frankiales bacterium]
MASSVPLAGEATDLGTPGSSADEMVGGGTVREPRTRLLGVLPFAVYTLAFLGVPTFALIVGAF